MRADKPVPLKFEAFELVELISFQNGPLGNKITFLFSSEKVLEKETVISAVGVLLFLFLSCP